MGGSGKFRCGSQLRSGKFLSRPATLRFDNLTSIEGRVMEILTTVYIYDYINCIKLYIEHSIGIICIHIYI